ILTYGNWQRRFGGDLNILNRVVHVSGEPYQVAGVLPEKFRYPFAAECDVFLPIRFAPGDLKFRGIHRYSGIARIRDDATLEQARSEMDVISKQIGRSQSRYEPRACREPDPASRRARRPTETRAPGPARRGLPGDSDRVRERRESSARALVGPVPRNCRA